MQAQIAIFLIIGQISTQRVIRVSSSVHSTHVEVRLTNVSPSYVVARLDPSGYQWKVVEGQLLTTATRLPKLKGCIHSPERYSKEQLLGPGEAVVLRYFYTAGDNIFKPWTRNPKFLRFRAPSGAVCVLDTYKRWQGVQVESTIRLSADLFLEAIRESRKQLFVAAERR